MILVALNLPHNRQWIGRRLKDYAQSVGKTPLDALLDLVLEEDFKMSFSTARYGDDEASWKLRAEAWADERCIVGGSDAGAHLDMINTFAFSTQLLGEGVRQRQLLPLERAVQLITSVPADRFGLKDRGRLQVGAAADLVVFDPDRIACGPIEMRHELPGGGLRLYAEANGVNQVIVNGALTVEHGRPTGILGGRVLRSGRDTYTVRMAT